MNKHAITRNFQVFGYSDVVDYSIFCDFDRFKTAPARYSEAGVPGPRIEHRVLSHRDVGMFEENTNIKIAASQETP